ncbi:MAG: T9SS type A sorting domain-containing protein [Chitinophagales bacterium]|nr:T9SS type A sorting domain-containing protein [Chitinophagales bacterium]
MKKYISTIVITALFFTAFSQKWALPSSTWIVGYSWLSQPYYYTLKVEGDTIIDGTACKKIGKSSSIYTYESNDTVYIYFANKFKPVYYFNAKIGDTVSYYNKHYWDGNCGIDSIVYAVIDKIDSVNVGNKFLKKFHSTVIGDSLPWGQNEYSYTEYIGSNYIYPYLYCPNYVDQESYGICNYGDSTIQNFYALQNNCLNVSVNNIPPLSEALSVYPNPAANTVNISIAENQPGLKLFVTDINGSIVHSQAIYSETTLDINNWAAGFYFVRIESNGKLMAMRKFVKE